MNKERRAATYLFDSKQLFQITFKRKFTSTTRYPDHSTTIETRGVRNHLLALESEVDTKLVGGYWQYVAYTI